MRVMVTGGSGFIGAYIIRELLRQRHEVFNIDIGTYAAAKGSRIKGLDVRSALASCGNRVSTTMTFEGFAPDLVIHAAAETHVDRAIDGPTAVVDNNTMSTQVLLEAARNWFGSSGTGPVFCYVSTDEVYGPVPAYNSEPKYNHATSIGFEENDRLNPRNPYAASKAASEHLVMAYFHTYNLQTVITRGANTYGTHQMPEKFLPMMICRAMQDKELPIYGDGHQIREWLHAEEHARGIVLAALLGKPGEIYNLGPGLSHENLQVAQEILRRMGKPDSLLTHVQDRPGHDREYAMCNDKALKELDWSPKRFLIGTESSGFGCCLDEIINFYTGDEGQAWLHEHCHDQLERRGLV